MRAEEQRTDRRIAEKAAKEQWEAVSYTHLTLPTNSRV